MASSRTPVAKPRIPSRIERDFAEGVEALVALVLSESQRLTRLASERTLTDKEGRHLMNLAQAAKALSTGTLWGARHIRAKLPADGK